MRPCTGKAKAEEWQSRRQAIGNSRLLHALDRLPLATTYPLPLPTPVPTASPNRPFRSQRRCASLCRKQGGWTCTKAVSHGWLRRAFC